MQAHRVGPDAGSPAPPSTESTSRARPFRELLDGSPEAILLVDATSRVLAANPAACGQLRRTQRQIRELGWPGLVDEADPRACGGGRRRGGTGQFVREMTLARGDGTRFPAQVFTSATPSDGDAPPLSLLIVRDLSAQKATEVELDEYRRRFEDLVRERAEEMREAGAKVRQELAERRLAEGALAESERRYRSLFENSPVAMWEEDHSATKAHLERLVASGVDDVAGYLLEHPAEYEHCVTLARTLDVNRAAVALFEAASREELLERQDDLFPPGSVGGLPAFWAAMLAGERSASFEETNLTLAGREVHVLETCSVAPGHEDSFDRVYIADVDVSERRRAESELVQATERLKLTLKSTVTTLGAAAELRDPYTAGHQRRVAELACAIATDLGWDGEQIESLRTAAFLHDIGKIVVPAEILSKPGKLSENEMLIIRQHASAGAEVLADIDFGSDIAEMVRQHHERLDGSGYPEGLTGDDILPEARILAVADVVEAMASHRPYRVALGMEAALAELRDQAGVKYDAGVVATCVRLVEEQGFQFTP